MNELSGKVAIVTGGAGGIGRGCVELFVEEGAKVVFGDTNVEAGQELAQKLGSAVRFLRCDVSAPSDLQALVDLAVSAFGGLDIMVNNAGISDQLQGPFLDLALDKALFDKLMSVNLYGLMVGCQYAGRQMAKQGGGSIVNISSMGALKAGGGRNFYRLTKAAINFFTKCIATELGEFNVRVNCICPGLIETGMSARREAIATAGLTSAQAQRVKEALAPVWMSERPIKRQGKPIDVANAALYFAGERSGYVTGSILPVEAGITAGDMGHLAGRLQAAREQALRKS